MNNVLRSTFLLSRNHYPARTLTIFSQNRRNSKNRNEKSNFLKNSAAAAVLASSYILYKITNKTNLHGLQNGDSNHIYTLDEVSKHVSKETGVWVTHNGKVYDITKFVDQHPGGKKILMAAGGSLEPFWAVYGMHNSSEVWELLDEYKIGVLSDKEMSMSSGKIIDDPFSNDPRRHPALKPASLKPFNAEPPPALLVDSFKTPNELFYVRNHMPVPEVDPETFRLTVVDNNNNSKILTMDDVKSLPKVTVTAAIQCAGNRRSEMSKVKPVKGLSWGHAAIGNADWSGARLTDVVKHCNLDGTPALHVIFQGLDVGLDGVSYAASVPAAVALDPRRDVILAYEMNGEPLPRDHGAPIRVVVPGVVGARNVKWLGRVVLSQNESDSHWQQNDYKGLPPGADWDTADFSKAPAIQELPVTSAICVPEQGDVVDLEDGRLIVKGYASSGGGKNIIRVDVSGDGGKTWHQADISSATGNRQWSWTLWEAKVPVTPGLEKVELWAKAVDSSYNTQPESFEHIWNFRGVLSNAYHKITVTLS